MLVLGLHLLAVLATEPALQATDFCQADERQLVAWT
jgi:hypothetical protein